MKEIIEEASIFYMSEDKRKYLYYILVVIGSDIRSDKIRDALYSGVDYDTTQAYTVISETYPSMMSFRQFIRDMKLEKILG